MTRHPPATIIISLIRDETPDVITVSEADLATCVASLMAEIRKAGSSVTQSLRLGSTLQAYTVLTMGIENTFVFIEMATGYVNLTEAKIP
jgi:hypothetical protein